MMEEKKVFCIFCKKQVPIKETDLSYLGGFYYCLSHIKQFTFISTKMEES